MSADIIDDNGISIFIITAFLGPILIDAELIPRYMAKSYAKAIRLQKTIYERREELWSWPTIMTR